MNIQDAKILVVDDDNVMRTYVIHMLNRIGVNEVKGANDGQKGLVVCRNFIPDLVLSDLHMSPMDGLEFVKCLRTHSELAIRRIPVVFMSADNSAGALNDSIQLGIKGYIIKPPLISLLKTKLEQALQDS